MGQYRTKHQNGEVITVPDRQIDDWRDDCELMCFIVNHPLDITRWPTGQHTWSAEVRLVLPDGQTLVGRDADCREAIRVVMRQLGHLV